ncbi:hypothetical protein C2W62_11710 [Candidatus Entotheonella serta]|nr:hypothetical protein C2W62_11710 [Candidatus Entotheonella serta]
MMPLFYDDCTGKARGDSGASPHTRLCGMITTGRGRQRSYNIIMREHVLLDKIKLDFEKK